MNLDRVHFERHGADRFFGFMVDQGVEWFFVDGQPRLKVGAGGRPVNARGAPVGTRLGFARGVHASRALDGFVEFGRRLDRDGKTRVDLVTRESAARTGSRIVLADDLGEHGLDDLRIWWPGPMIWLETSPWNFQALLITPRPLNDTEHLRLARHLVSKFGADPGAASRDRFHRFPGAPNFKELCRPFFVGWSLCMTWT
jgi:hypothetical protein